MLLCAAQGEILLAQPIVPLWSFERTIPSTVFRRSMLSLSQRENSSSLRQTFVTGALTSSPVMV